MLIVLRDANPHPELWTNTTLEAFPSSAKIATEEMAAWSCFAILLAVSGISPLAYLVRLSRAYRTRLPPAPAAAPSPAPRSTSEYYPVLCRRPRV